MQNTITVTSQEFAHILAGLRSLQREYYRRASEEGSTAEGEKLLKLSFPQLEDVDVLNPEAIDALCERINTQEEPRISIHVSGGVVTDVRSDIPLDVDVFDEDCDFKDADDFDIAQTAHNSLPVEVY